MKMIDLTAVDCKKFSEKCDWSCLVLCTIVDYYTIGNSSKSPLKRFHILHRAVLVKVSTWLCIYSYIYDIFFWLKVSQVPISLDINITNFGGLHGKRELQRKISPRRSEQSSIFNLPKSRPVNLCPFYWMVKVWVRSGHRWILYISINS